MLFKLVVGTAVKNILNHMLYRDRALQMPRQRLVGKTLRFELQEIECPLTLSFTQQQLTVQMERLSEVDCQVRVSISQLGRLRDRRQLTSLIRSDNLSVEGDPQVIQHWVALLEAAEWDPAELLAPWIGDIAAQGVSQCIQSCLVKTEQLLIRRRESLADLLIEEWRILPGAMEIASFNHQVAVEVQRMATLAVRLEKMENQQ